MVAAQQCCEGKCWWLPHDHVKEKETELAHDAYDEQLVAELSEDGGAGRMWEERKREYEELYKAARMWDLVQRAERSRQEAPSAAKFSLSRAHRLAMYSEVARSMCSVCLRTRSAP